ncbi:MAG TPA: hypothetical protein VKD22_09500 [Ramlibacter sp.]|nr:hypothetical protein [Ramlibacter sp.]
MAHDCPDCGMQCHCGGDIDDINFGESDACTHYKSPDCYGSMLDDDGGDDYYYPDMYDDEPEEPCKP